MSEPTIKLIVYPYIVGLPLKTNYQTVASFVGSGCEKVAAAANALSATVAKVSVRGRLLDKLKITTMLTADEADRRRSSKAILTRQVRGPGFGLV